MPHYPNTSCNYYNLKVSGKVQEKLNIGIFNTIMRFTSPQILLESLYKFQFKNKMNINAGYDPTS